MKTFKAFKKDNEESGFTINSNGEAIPNEPVHFKLVANPPKKKKEKKLKEHLVLEAEGKPKVSSVRDLPGEVPKAKSDPNEHWTEASKRQYEINKPHRDLTDELHKHQKELTSKEKEHVESYTEGGEVGGIHSYEIAHKLIQNHKTGKPPTHGMEPEHKEIHNTISKLASQKLGKNVHLYSGVGFNPKKAAEKSEHGIIHLPSHISASHSARVASEFASAAAEHGFVRGKHVIHIDAKAHDKGFHVGNHSILPHEHETILPAGTKLKYSHSTVHKDDDGAKINVHHFTIHHQE